MTRFADTENNSQSAEVGKAIVDSHFGLYLFVNEKLNSWVVSLHSMNLGEAFPASCFNPLRDK